MTLSINNIPQEKQNTLEMACKEVEWMDEKVTAERVEQYIRQYLHHRGDILPSLIKVFVEHWHSPADSEAVR